MTAEVCLLGTFLFGGVTGCGKLATPIVKLKYSIVTNLVPLTSAFGLFGRSLSLSTFGSIGGGNP